jgi:hypothetical protein
LVGGIFGFGGISRVGFAIGGKRSKYAGFHGAIFLDGKCVETNFEMSSSLAFSFSKNSAASLRANSCRNGVTHFFFSY